MHEVHAYYDYEHIILSVVDTVEEEAGIFSILSPCTYPLIVTGPGFGKEAGSTCILCPWTYHRIISELRYIYAREILDNITSFMSVDKWRGLQEDRVDWQYC